MVVENKYLYIWSGSIYGGGEIGGRRINSLGMF